MSKSLDVVPEANIWSFSLSQPIPHWPVVQDLPCCLLSSGRSRKRPAVSMRNVGQRHSGMAIMKGILDLVTVLPDSIGWKQLPGSILGISRTL